MSSLQTIFEMETVTSTEVINAKSTANIYEKRRDTLAMEIAKRLQLPKPGNKFWTIDEVNWNDPRIADIKDDFHKANSQMIKWQWESSRLQAIHENHLPRHEAKVKAYKFLGKLSDEQAINFLKTHHLTTTTLTEAILLCPRLLDDLSDFEENLEIIRANENVWW